MSNQYEVLGAAPKAEDLKKSFSYLEIIDWGETREFHMIVNATSIGLKENEEIKLVYGNCWIYKENSIRKKRIYSNSFNSNDFFSIRCFIWILHWLFFK